jgi:preprotein translocase subunit YajC
MTHSEHVEIGDLVVVDTGILGKLVYKVTNDFLHIKLENIDNGFEHDKCFKSLFELEEFIREQSGSVILVALH